MITDNELLVEARKLAIRKTMREAQEWASTAAMEETEMLLEDMRKDIYAEKYKEIFEQECADRYEGNIEKIYKKLLRKRLEHA